jgi:hypothetical protein
MNPSERSHLLTVENAFHFERAGLLVLRPDFSVPEAFPAQHIETVRIDTPGGTSFEAPAQFNLSHINIASAEPLLDQRWRLTVSLMETSPEQVPVGSRISASAELVARVHKRQSAEANGGPASTLGNPGITEGRHR